MIKCIAIIGPESTGKSWLAESLASWYKGRWVPEYAREYLNKLGRTYDYTDIMTIASMQFQMIQKAARALRKSEDEGTLLKSRLLFLDTELIVTKIWCDVKYGKCHPRILKNIAKQEIDLYLLTNIDLPWEDDPLREHPHLRDSMFDLYKQELEIRSLPYAIISGVGEERLKNATTAIESVL